MDELGCKSRFFTSFNRTCFVKRRDDYTFWVSPVISHKETATTDSPSPRECFFYLGKMVHEEKCHWESFIGDSFGGTIP